MAHGDEQFASLADVAFLIRTRPRGSQIAIFGDINVDQLPTFSGDLFQTEDFRDFHYAIERHRLSNFSDHFDLDIRLPDSVDGCPSGPFSDACLIAPISRIRVGLQSKAKQSNSKAKQRKATAKQSKAKQSKAK